MGYLTPKRFRNMGLGSDLTGVTDAELSSVIERASQMVDTYCCVPNLPQKHSFKGGVITTEQHVFRKGQVRVYPWHKPLKSIEQFRVYATNNVYLEIKPIDIFVEPAGGFFEIVAMSLTPVGFWAATNIISLTNPVSRINYTYGYEFQVSGEILDLVYDGSYVSQNQFWDSTPEVFVNGSAVSSGYTVDTNEGAVTFSPAIPNTSIVSVNYTHPMPSAVAQATGVVVSSVLAERQLVAAGMGNLDSIHVEEIDLRRTRMRMANKPMALPESAEVMLAPFVFTRAM